MSTNSRKADEAILNRVHPRIYLLLKSGSRGYCLKAVPDTVSSVCPHLCPHLCPKCLTLCFWQFAPIVQHFLIGGTLEDWAQSTAKECDIPF